MSDDSKPCPSCGRPPTFEYRVERDKCRLWQQFHELHHQPDERAIANCMAVTEIRIAELKAALAQTTERANQAQAALRRHHKAQATVQAMFPDNATFELEVEPRTYQDRKVAESCTYPRCPEPPCDDCNECPRHRAASATRRARSRAKNRRAWSRQKLCLRCGRKRRPGSKWCSPCLIKTGKLRAAEQDKQRDNSPARTTREVEDDGYARSRYHGQARRGQQKRWQLDLQDIDDAIERLQWARTGILEARDAADAQMPRVQRDEIRMAAVAQAAHAGRFIAEIRDRNGDTDDPSK